ncbi:hypothetical protein [Ascidiimonas sp. W6]|uniref:hypothetical protein n=1 Tax=Ascidiimonas meishanensis TaxID=3128903 RepID=UPI0030EF916A
MFCLLCMRYQMAQIPHGLITPKSVLDWVQTTPYEILFQRDFYNKKYKGMPFVEQIAEELTFRMDNLDTSKKNIPFLNGMLHVIIIQLSN